MSTDVRRCSDCKRIMPIDRFPHDRCNGDKKHQRRYICGKCATARRDAWVARMTPAEREAYLERRRAASRNTPAHLARLAENRQRLQDDIDTLNRMLDQLQAWGYSAYRIARVAGCNPTTIHRWIRTRGEGARTVQRQTVDKISRVYLAAMERERINDAAAR